MIGFDLVALEQSRQSPHYGTSRYLQKILTPGEIRQFKELLSFNDLALYCWCIKESAFKALPHFLQVRFNPHRIVIEDLASSKGTWTARSCYNGIRIRSELTISVQTLKCISISSENAFHQTENRVFRSTPASLSAKMKAMAKKAVQEKFGKAALLSSLENGKPVLMFSERALEIISFSHDGDFAGFAIMTAFPNTAV